MCEHKKSFLVFDKKDGSGKYVASIQDLMGIHQIADALGGGCSIVRANGGGVEVRESLVNVLLALEKAGYRHAAVLG